MDKKAQKLKDQIQKLTIKLQKIEDKHEQSIAKLIKETSRKGIDIRVLAGMIQNAHEIVDELKHKVEAWEELGEKFLFRKKDPSNSKTDQPNKKQTPEAK